MMVVVSSPSQVVGDVDPQEFEGTDLLDPNTIYEEWRWVYVLLSSDVQDQLFGTTLSASQTQPCGVFHPSLLCD